MLKAILEYYNINNKKFIEFLVNLTGAGLVIMAVATITYIIFQFLIKRRERLRKEAGMCSFLECIRCNHKLFVLREARRRLTLYILEIGNRGICRLQESLRTRFHYTPVLDVQIADDEKYMRNPLVFKLDDLPSTPWWVDPNSSDNNHQPDKKKDLPNHSNGKITGQQQPGNEEEEQCQQQQPSASTFLRQKTLSTSTSLKTPEMPSLLDRNPLKEDVGILQKNFGVISEEFHQIWNISADGREERKGQWKNNSTSQGQWSLFHLQNQGQWIVENAKYCPKTIDVLSTLPNLMAENVFGNVYFSIIYPGTNITDHYGATNIRIRCHLGLIIPPDCFLKVAGQSHHWKAKQCILFDDSYLHSAHHLGTPEEGPRVVLLVDLWHPDINPQERQAIECIFPPDIAQKQL